MIGAAGNSGRSMAMRALAEMCGYYLLAAAHGLGNLTVRTLMLSRPAAAALNIKLPSTKGFPPFSEDRASWPPLNSKMASAAKHAALASGEGAAVDLAQVILDILAAPRWIALVNRRDTDFHRWRPQGLPTGGCRNARSGIDRSRVRGSFRVEPRSTTLSITRNCVESPVTPLMNSERP